VSLHLDKTSGRYVVRFRDADGCNRRVTVNETNLTKYGQHVPNRITERVAKRLERAVLAQETAPDGSARTQVRQRMLWMEVLARYLPPLLDANGRDKWEHRPKMHPLENERSYPRNELENMQRVLAIYFPSYLEYGKIRWRRTASRRHGRAEAVHACSKPMGSVTIEDIVGFQRYLAEQKLAPTTVRDYVALVRGFLGWCVERHYLHENPATKLKLPSRTVREVKWLEREQARTLLNGVKGHPLEGPVRTVLGLGLRLTEMTGLEWRDINFDKGIVRVRGTKTKNALREVPLPMKLARYFKGLELSESPHVLLNTKGMPWCKASLNCSIRRFRSRNHLGFHWCFQMLRATYGSILVLDKIPIAHAALVLGHGDVRTTQRWYLGLNSTHVAPEIARVINKAFR